MHMLGLWGLCGTCLCNPGLFQLFSTCVAQVFSTSWGLIVFGSMVVVTVVVRLLLGRPYWAVTGPTACSPVSTIATSVPEPAITLLSVDSKVAVCNCPVWLEITLFEMEQ